MSRSHANRGKAWEQWLDRVHLIYQMQQRAVVVRLQPRFKVLGQAGKGQFRGVWEGPGPVDYVAMAQGQVFAFDAKSSGHRLTFEGIPREQALCLDAWQQQGAYTFIALCLTGNPPGSGAMGAYVVPWVNFRALYWEWQDAPRGSGKKASLSVRDLNNGMGTPMHGHGWLETIRGPSEVQEQP